MILKAELDKNTKTKLRCSGLVVAQLPLVALAGDLGLVPSLTGQLIAIRSCSYRRSDMTPWHQVHTWGIDIHKGSMPTHINSF